jgi:DNA-binding winged helix-turn-helix (wHTH) protein/pimeloyl-ACP methyl ester carboxylesterase
LRRILDADWSALAALCDDLKEQSGASAQNAALRASLPSASRLCLLPKQRALPCPSFLIALLLPFAERQVRDQLEHAWELSLAFLFGDLVLDAGRRELRSGAKLLAVEPQVFDLLVFLIRNRDRVVSKDDLLATVWGGRIVSDSAIAARINAARRTIGDDGVEQRWIRTIARKGFRFVGDVSEVRESARPSSATDQVDARIDPHASRAQEVTFCRTKDGVNIAVASVGRGLPVVRASHRMTHIEWEWQSPLRTPLLHFLADRYRLIRYDCRNNGLSDWDVAEVSFEAFQDDLETAIGAFDLSSYALLGMSQGAPVSIAHAVRHPERVSKLIVHGGYALGRDKRPRPNGFDLTALLGLMSEGWGDEHSAFSRMLATAYLPDASADRIKWMADLQRVGTSPENLVRSRRVFAQIDLVDLLPKVSVPTLVMHCRHDNAQPFEEGRRMATLIPNAKFVALESANHVPLPGEPAWPIFLNAIETFLSDP